MSMILAISASDMHRRGLEERSPGRPTAEDHARYYYGMAVRDLRQLLESPKRRVSQRELEMIFICVFLMIIHEWQYGFGGRSLQLHLHGLRSLLETFPNMFQVQDLDAVLLAANGEQLETVTGRMSFMQAQLLLCLL